MTTATANADKAKPKNEPVQSAPTSKVRIPEGQRAPARKDHIGPSGIPVAGWATPEPSNTDDQIDGDRLLETATTAVGQIIQIGLTGIAQALRAIGDRLPHP